MQSCSFAVSPSFTLAPSRTLALHAGCTFVKVKNKKDIPGNLFNSMDPFDVGLFSDGDEQLPVIRMVFALGSGECGMKFPAHWQDKSDQTGKFTSYDIRCAGLSRDTFACVGDDLHWYEDLLRRSLS